MPSNPPRYEAEGRAKHDWFPDGQPIRLRLFPEYMVDVPVFPRSDDTDALLPEGLLDRLIAWNEFFNENYHYEKGWRSEEAKEKWAEEAPSLVADLKDSLADKAELEIDLWPERGPVMRHS